MSDATPRLALPYLAAAQAQKHVTLNESLIRLDALVQCAVESRTLAVEPAALDGQLYILPPGKTGGSWGPMADGALAHLRDGVWEMIAPAEGWTAFVKDAGESVVFTSAHWRPASADRVARSGDSMSGPLSAPELRLTSGADVRGVIQAQSGGGLAIGAGATPRLVVGGATAGALYIEDAGFGRADLRGLSPTLTLNATSAGADRKYVRVNNFDGNFSVDALNDGYGAPALLLLGVRGTGSSWRRLQVSVPLTVRPGSSVLPETEGEVTFELTTNTALTFRAKGSDGVIRSATLTLA